MISRKHSPACSEPDLLVRTTQICFSEFCSLATFCSGLSGGKKSSVGLFFLSQIEACNKEAEKIESLINSDSPTLASHVPLSALIASQVQVSFSISSPAAHLGPSLHSLLVSLLLTFLALMPSM